MCSVSNRTVDHYEAECISVPLLGKERAGKRGRHKRRVGSTSVFLYLYTQWTPYRGDEDQRGG